VFPDPTETLTRAERFEKRRRCCDNAIPKRLAMDVGVKLGLVGEAVSLITNNVAAAAQHLRHRSAPMLAVFLCRGPLRWAAALSHGSRNPRFVEHDAEVGWGEESRRVVPWQQTPANKGEFPMAERRR
jgi:hypothetical protein